MDQYVGTKIVLAEPMSQGSAMSLGLLRADTVVEVDENGKTAEGYSVVYEDGYKSWSPKETFERAYRKITDNELSLLTRKD